MGTKKRYHYEYEYICYKCGKVFIAPNPRKYCSKECKVSDRKTKEYVKVVKPKCPGPSLDNCLTCPFEECIGGSIRETKEEGQSINKAIGKGNIK